MPYLSKSLAVWLPVTLLVTLLVSCNLTLIRGSDQELPTTTTIPHQPTAAEPPPGPSSLQARIALPRGSGGVAFGNQSIWVSNTIERSLLRIDIGRSQVVSSSIALNFEPQDIAYGEGAIWVGSADRTRLARIEPQTNQVVAMIDLQALQLPLINHLWVAAGEGAVWLTNETTVIQIDPQTNQLVGPPLQTGEEIIAIALGHGTFWTRSHDDGIVARIDAKTHRVVARIDVGFAVHGLAVGEEAAWVLDEHGFAVVQLDPQTNRLGERIPIDFVAANVAAGAASVWVAPAARDSGQATGNDAIARISVQENRVVETIHVGDAATSQYYAVRFAMDSVWVHISTPAPAIVHIKP